MTWNDEPHDLLLSSCISSLCISTVCDINIFRGSRVTFSLNLRFAFWCQLVFMLVLAFNAGEDSF